MSKHHFRKIIILVAFMSCSFLITSCTYQIHVRSILKVLVLGQSNAENYLIWENFEYRLAKNGYLVYLIQAAQGSTRLIAKPQHWMPPQGENFLRLIDLYQSHESPSIDFIIWHQGEGDAAFLENKWADQYSSGFNNLIRGLQREILGDWSLIAGSIPIGNYASEEAIFEINDALAKNANVKAFVDFSDLSLEDGIHFADKPEVGKRWAESVLELLAISSSTP